MLGHDPFKVVLARQPEQALGVALDMVAKQEPFAMPGHHGG